MTVNSRHVHFRIIDRSTIMQRYFWVIPNRSANRRGKKRLNLTQSTASQMRGFKSVAYRKIPTILHNGRVALKQHLVGRLLAVAQRSSLIATGLQPPLESKVLGFNP